MTTVANNLMGLLLFLMMVKVYPIWEADFLTMQSPDVWKRKLQNPLMGDRERWYVRLLLLSPLGSLHAYFSHQRHRFNSYTAHEQWHSNIRLLCVDWHFICALASHSNALSGILGAMVCDRISASHGHGPTLIPPLL